MDWRQSQSSTPPLHQPLTLVQLWGEIKDLLSVEKEASDHPTPMYPSANSGCLPLLQLVACCLEERGWLWVSNSSHHVSSGSSQEIRMQMGVGRGRAGWSKRASRAPLPGLPMQPGSLTSPGDPPRPFRGSGAGRGGAVSGRCNPDLGKVLGFCCRDQNSLQPRTQVGVGGRSPPPPSLLPVRAEPRRPRGRNGGRPAPCRAPPRGMAPYKEELARTPVLDCFGDPGQLPAPAPAHS